MHIGRGIRRYKVRNKKLGAYNKNKANGHVLLQVLQTRHGPHHHRKGDVCTTLQTRFPFLLVKPNTPILPSLRSTLLYAKSTIKRRLKSGVVGVGHWDFHFLYLTHTPTSVEGRKTHTLSLRMTSQLVSDLYLRVPYLPSVRRWKTLLHELAVTATRLLHLPQLRGSNPALTRSTPIAHLPLPYVGCTSSGHRRIP